MLTSFSKGKEPRNTYRSTASLRPFGIQIHRFPDHQGKLYTAEIVLAFSYLHSLNVVYRDLKPEVHCVHACCSSATAVVPGEKR